MTDTAPPSNHYSAMLYALSDEILKEDGCVTAASQAVANAALRIDDQTLEIRCLKIQHGDLYCALKRLLLEVEPDENCKWAIGTAVEEARHVLARYRSSAA